MIFSLDRQIMTYLCNYSTEFYTGSSLSQVLVENTLNKENTTMSYNSNPSYNHYCTNIHSYSINTYLWMNSNVTQLSAGYWMFKT